MYVCWGYDDDFEGEKGEEEERGRRVWGRRSVGGSVGGRGLKWRGGGEGGGGGGVWGVGWIFLFVGEMGGV